MIRVSLISLLLLVIHTDAAASAGGQDTAAVWNPAEYLVRQQQLTEEEKDGVLGRVMWQSFRYLVEHFAFEPGQTYYLVGPRDDAQHDRLVRKIVAAGWDATPVTGRVEESRLDNAYHTLDGVTVCCEILRTNLEDENQYNRRSVLNVNTTAPRIVHRLFTQAEPIMMVEKEGATPVPGWSCDPPRLASRGDNFIRIQVPKQKRVR